LVGTKRATLEKKTICGWRFWGEVAARDEGDDWSGAPGEQSKRKTTL